jgi:hypothetical protein
MAVFAWNREVEKYIEMLCIVPFSVNANLLACMSEENLTADIPTLAFPIVMLRAACASACCNGNSENSDNTAREATMTPVIKAALFKGVPP